MTPRVYTYTAGENGLHVNSYLVELESGVVAVDASLLNSDAEAFRTRFEALGKPLLAVLVTHPHPDHYNGVATLVREAHVPVHATADVTRVIRATADAKRAQWGPVYGEEWPAETVYPNAIVGDGETVTVGGAPFRVHDLGAGESDSESVWVLEGDAPVAFVGDLVYNAMHCYNADGHSGAWLDQLETAASLLVPCRRLYPGHGEPGGPELLARQREYLLMYREAVLRLLGDDAEPADGAKAQLVERMSRYLPNAPLQWLVSLSADAVAAELRAERTPAAVGS